MLLFGVVLLVGAYALLLPLLDNLVAKSLQSQLGLAEKPEVNLTGDPLNMLAGRFKGGRITLANPGFGDLRPDRVTVDLDPFDIDVLGSLRSGRVKSERPLSGNLQVELSEEEVARIATSSGTATVPVKSVELEEGSVVVGSEVEAFRTRVPVSVEGNLLLRDDALYFRPVRIEALGTAVPKRLTQGLLRGADFSYAIGRLPFRGTFSDVEVHKGRLVLSGEVDRLPVGYETG